MFLRKIITNAFQKNLDESEKPKSNKVWIDNGSEFYNRSIKSWLQGKNIETYSAYNEGKSIVAQRFIRSLKNKIYKYMTAISKNVYIDKLDDIFNDYKNTCHRTIKMKLFDVKTSTFIVFDVENYDKDHNLKVSDHVRISKCKKLFVKGYTPNWSEKGFEIKKLKNTELWTYAIEYLNGEEIA